MALLVGLWKWSWNQRAVDLRVDLKLNSRNSNENFDDVCAGEDAEHPGAWSLSHSFLQAPLLCLHRPGGRGSWREMWHQSYTGGQCL